MFSYQMLNLVMDTPMLTWSDKGFVHVEDSFLWAGVGPGRRKSCISKCEC